MSDEKERLFQEVRKFVSDNERERQEGVRVIRIDKRTHHIRFEDETEDEVVVVIEKKGSKK